MTRFKVPDMSCGHCAKAVTEAVHSVDPDASVDVDLRTKLVSIASATDATALAAAIKASGYDEVAVVQ